MKNSTRNFGIGLASHFAIIYGIKHDLVSTDDKGSAV